MARASTEREASHEGGAPESISPDYDEVRAFFDVFAAIEQRWRRRNRTYHRLVEQVFRFQIPPGQRVLEIGSGSGDLLAALRPAVGVGVDVSVGMVRLARSLHPELRFEVGAGEELDLGEPFDYVVLSDLMPFVHDLQSVLERVAAHSHPRTRIVINSYSRAWKPIIALAERLRLKPRKPLRNWVAPHDLHNLLDLAGFEVLTTSKRMLLPKQVPVLTTFLNGFLASVWPFNHLCLTYWVVARLRAKPLEEQSVSIICPCRNEAGNVPSLVARLPGLGTATELIFVEGGSTDGTRAAIARQIELHPELDISLVDQPGRGKGDAVRAGFEAAKHDVLIILDGDLGVRPEDLPKFYRALVQGNAELVNGSRLVYDVEPGAMRFLNTMGNKIFSRLFKGVTGYYVKDTLCGTKALLRRDYELIAAARPYFGEFDPFGDFDLLLGAARLNLKIADLPVRYQPRAYGRTNISRWRHSWLLLRMMAFGYWKFKVALYTRRARVPA